MNVQNYVTLRWWKSIINYVFLPPLVREVRARLSSFIVFFDDLHCAKPLTCPCLPASSTNSISSLYLPDTEKSTLSLPQTRKSSSSSRRSPSSSFSRKPSSHFQSPCPTLTTSLWRLPVEAMETTHQTRRLIDPDLCLGAAAGGLHGHQHQRSRTVGRGTTQQRELLHLRVRVMPQKRQMQRKERRK